MASILKVDTIQDQDGNNIINESANTITIGASGDTVNVPGTEVKTNKVSPTSGTTLTLGDSGDTITIPSGATISNLGTATGFGGANTPAFEATMSASQSLTESTYTKVQFNTENFDTDGDYDNATNYRFTPSTAGKYHFYLSIDFNAGGGGEFERGILSFYKNGTAVHYQIEGDTSEFNGNKRGLFSIHKTIEMNGTTDYVEAYVFLEHDAQGAGSVRTFSSNVANIFGAYKIIE